MSERRRLLLAIANQFKWLPYSYENLYYGLVPVKVNRDKDLPNEYQQVEFIESTGTQYINAGVLINENSKVLLDISFNSTTSGDYVNGISGNFTNGRFAVGNGYGNDNVGFYFGIANENLWVGTKDTNRHKFLIDMPNLTYGIDNNFYSKSSYTYPTFENNYFYLFARNQRNSIGNYCLQKLYSCQFYENNNLIRNFIPCYRKSDNVIGLFDTVNQVFYTNAGTGTFSKGADTYALVKNKARVEKVYGNSVVENQLVRDNVIFYNNSNITITDENVTLNEYKATTSSGSFNSQLLFQKSWSGVYRPVANDNHVYFMFAWVKANVTNAFSVFIKYDGSNISSNSITLSNSYQFVYFLGKRTQRGGDGRCFLQTTTQSYQNQTSGDSITIRGWQAIDLTQMFPFDTPTTLTDTRVQALLNRGYIPYNTGEIKSVDIGEISTTKSDTTALDTIPFKYQGSGVGTSHDTLERTDTEWVFTKNMNSVDLGSLSWTNRNSDARYGCAYTYITEIKYASNNSVLANIVCPDYTTLTFADIYNNGSSTTLKGIGLSVANVEIKDPTFRNYTNEQIATALNGIYLYYELATPQVIRIPRKRLGVKKIRDLSWVYSTTTNRFSSNITDAKPTLNNETLANIYCSPFMSKTYSQTLNENLCIGLDIVSYCYIKDTSISTTTDFINKYGDYLIFFETNTEVEDMPFLFGIESGGTITTDSEVLPNVDFEMKCK